MYHSKEIISQFVTESKEYLESIEDDLLSLEKNVNNPDPALVNKVFRIHHTIKEAAAFLDLKNVTELALVMEKISSLIRAGEIKPEPVIIAALLKGEGRLNALLDNIEHSNEMDISEIHAHLLNVLSGNVSEKVRKELDTDVSLSTLQGYDIGFEIDAFTWKSLAEEGKYLYLLKYDLTELADSGNKTPLWLIRHLLSKGDILEGKLKTAVEDLHAGLPQGPLLYQILYSTTLDQEQMQKTTGLPGSRILSIKTPEKGKADQRPSDTFRDYILPEIVEANVNRKEQGDFVRIRILSIGLPTGLEPYTIVLLIDQYLGICGFQGISIDDFSILASDAAPKALAKAIIGEYSEEELSHSSCREKKRKYFKPDENSWSIHDWVRSMVEFRQINLAAPFIFTEKFDVIFCHNNLNSWDIETRENIVRQFYSSLSANGFLLPGAGTGKSFKGLISARKFEPVRYGGKIVYKKRIKDR